MYRYQGTTGSLLPVHKYRYLVLVHTYKRGSGSTIGSPPEVRPVNCKSVHVLCCQQRVLDQSYSCDFGLFATCVIRRYQYPIVVSGCECHDQRQPYENECMIDFNLWG